MTGNKSTYAVAAALVASMALAGCKKKEEPAVMTPPPEAMAPAPAPMPAEPAPMPVPSSINVVSVDLGTMAGADMKIAQPTSTFAAKDKIIVSIGTEGTASNAELAAKLTFQDGQTAGEQKQALNATGPGTTNIEFTNANPWPVGKYKAEVALNGAVVQSRDFEVK